MTHPPAPDPLLGHTVAGRYHVVRKLSQGGMGAIYLATQQPLGREVALKVLLNTVAHDETAVQRFEQEARAVSRLRHPHIITLYDFGRTEDGRLFIAMEFLDGESLRDAVQKAGRLPYRRALHVVKGIVSGLAEAHRLGIMHRDLKPENVMLVNQAGDPDFVKMLDFGLARSVAAQETDARLTQQNTIPGTPAYLPPERAAGVDDDLRSDLYSLGALWFELLCGRPPFDGDSAIKIIVRHMQEPAPSPRAAGADPALPPAMEALVSRLLEKQPERRPESAEALLKELLGLESSDSWTVASATQVAARATHVPRLSALALEEEEDALGELGELGELRFEPLSLAELDEEPIALTRRKGPPAGAPAANDTSEAAVVLLTRVKAPQPPARAPLTSIAEAASRVGGAKNLLDVAQVLVDYLRSRFERVAVVDRRFPPSRVLDAFGTTTGDDTARAFDQNDALWQLVARGEAYYGPALQGPAWSAFYSALSGQAPGGMLVAALKRDGAPAFLVYAAHASPQLHPELKDAATLLKEAAAALTVLSF